MASLDPTGNYFSTPTAVGDTALTDCYTCPTSKWAYITQILLCDDGGAARTATVKVTKSSTDYVLKTTTAVDDTDGLSIAFEPCLVLAAGDKIKVQSDAAGLHVIVTGHEGSRGGT